VREVIEDAYLRMQSIAARQHVFTAKPGTSVPRRAGVYRKKKRSGVRRQRGRGGKPKLQSAGAERRNAKKPSVWRSKRSGKRLAERKKNARKLRGEQNKLSRRQYARRNRRSVRLNESSRKQKRPKLGDRPNFKPEDAASPRSRRRAGHSRRATGRQIGFVPLLRSQHPSSTPLEL
jgi:hypothetical protein